MGGIMRYLAGTAKWGLLVVFLTVGFMGNVSTAGQVLEFGESGFMNIDYQVQLRAAMRDTGSGRTGLDDSKDIYLRRNRLSFLGAVNETFGYALQLEYNGDRRINDLSVAKEDSDMDLLVLDAYVTAVISDALQFRLGKSKHVLTREVLEGCFDPLTLDRSIFILGPFEDKTTRDTGIVAFGNLFSDVFQYRLAIMEGNRSRYSSPESAGYRYTGRVHVSLLDPETGYGYRGTYLGKKNVLTFGFGYEVEADAVYGTQLTGAEDYSAYTYDAFYEHPGTMGTFTLSGGYLKADFGEAGVRGVMDATGATGEKNGRYGKAAYMVGKVQVYGRVENWAFAQLNGVGGQEVTQTSGGLNYYVKGQDLKLTLDHTQTDFEKANIPGFTTIIGQVQARF